MQNFTAIDLFSGCGGSATGFRDTGFEITAAVDNDYWSTKTYKRNHPKTALFREDIKYISGKQLLGASGIKKGQLTVLLACPPCQGFSSARNNGSSYDPRNELVFEFVRLVKEIIPKMIAMENVPGLSRGKGKNIFLKVVEQLNKAGYATIYGVLNASDYGVPQNRKRVILLGTRIKNIRLKFPEPTHGYADGLKPKVTVRQAIENLPRISFGETYPSDTMHSAADLSELNLKRLRITPVNGGGWKNWPDELKLVCHTKQGRTGHGDVYGRMRWDEPSPTLTAGCTAISKGRFGHPEQNRTISLREAARLQSFPNSYIFEGTFTSISNQIGNAVPPLLAKNIAETLMKALKEERKLAGIYKKVFIKTKNEVSAKSYSFLSRDL